MAKRLLITTPIIALLLSMTGCDQASSDANGHSSAGLAPANASLPPDDTDEYCGDPTLDTQTRTTTTTSGEYTVELIGLPASVPSNELFSFEVDLSTAPGIPNQNLSILIDAGMPQHAHGMTVRPTATPVNTDGRFRVEGMLFHMPGSWDLTVDVLDGPYTERVTFHVEAR